MIAMLLGLPAAVRCAAAGVGAVIVLAGVFAWHGHAEYARGRAEERAAWQRASDLEETRQKAINAASDRLQQQAVAELQKRNADLSALLEANDAEAAKDPRAAAPAFGRDSVRRLNAVR